MLIALISVNSLGDAVPQEATGLPSEGDETSSKLARFSCRYYRCRHVVSLFLALKLSPSSH